MLAPGLPGRLQIYEGETPGFGKIEKFERAKTYFPTVIQNKKAFLSPKKDNFHVYPIKQFPIKGHDLVV